MHEKNTYIISAYYEKKYSKKKMGYQISLSDTAVLKKRNFQGKHGLHCAALLLSQTRALIF